MQGDSGLHSDPFQQMTTPELGSTTFDQPSHDKNRLLLTPAVQHTRKRMAYAYSADLSTPHTDRLCNGSQTPENSLDVHWLTVHLLYLPCAARRSTAIYYVALMWRNSNANEE